jgi:hypothetical protein
MYKKLLLKRKILLLLSVLCISFSTFAQTPYNIVMNIYDDPTTKMAFNWFIGVGIIFFYFSSIFFNQNFICLCVIQRILC